MTCGFLRNLTLVAALGFFLPLTWLAHLAGLGLGGIWAALTLFVVVRLVGLLARVRGTSWAVAGAVRYDRADEAREGSASIGLEV